MKPLLSRNCPIPFLQQVKPLVCEQGWIHLSITRVTIFLLFISAHHWLCIFQNHLLGHSTALAPSAESKMSMYQLTLGFKSHC